MEDTQLSVELKHKSEDVKFYPTVYFEGIKTGLVVKKELYLWFGRSQWMLL